MSGLQDETNFSAGGGDSGGKFVRRLPERPDPLKVKDVVSGQITEAQKAAQLVIDAAYDEYDLNGNGIDDRLEALLDTAGQTHTQGLAHAHQPVVDKLSEIAELEAKLRQARIDLKAAKVSEKLEKGDVKAAFQLAVKGAHEVAQAEFATAETVRSHKLADAQAEVQKVRDAGGNAVKAEQEALSAYKSWLRHDTSARRTAAVKAVWAMASTIYNTAFYADSSGVELPEVLAKRQSGGGDQPTPPQA